MIFLAHTDTEHFEWQAFGNNADDARDVLVKGFNRHLVEVSASFDMEAEHWTVERFDAEYGIRVLQVQPHKCFRDGELI